MAVTQSPSFAPIHDLPCIAHASCVAVGARGLLIVGPSGSGKSSLALQMIALGAHLVADDRCLISEVGGALSVSRPPGLPNAIEARGLGLLSQPCQHEAHLTAVLDMTRPAQTRMPERTTCRVGDHDVALLQNPVMTHGAAALFLYLRHGFHD